MLRARDLPFLEEKVDELALARAVHLDQFGEPAFRPRGGRADRRTDDRVELADKIGEHGLEVGDRRGPAAGLGVETGGETDDTERLVRRAERALDR